MPESGRMKITQKKHCPDNKRGFGFSQITILHREGPSKVTISGSYFDKKKAAYACFKQPNLKVHLSTRSGWQSQGCSK